MVSQKKIAIIGLGKIGTAHLRSFLKFKDINYFLVDRDKNKLLMIKKMMVKAKHKNFLLSNKLPSNINFDFVIISTDPKDRFTIFKKLTDKNKIQNLLFEKFLFNNLSHYKKTQNILNKKKIKSYEKVWSKLLIDRLRLNFYKNNNEIKISMPKNCILTNLIHFYTLFFYIGSKKKIKIDLKNLKIKLGGYYSNGTGEIVLNDDKNNKMIIDDKHFKKNDFSIHVKYKHFVKKIRFSKGKLLQNNGKKVVNFPLSSETTSKFFFNLIKNKKNIGLPEYKKVTSSL